MATALELDLRRLKDRAFDRADWAAEVLRAYHVALSNLGDVAVQQVRRLYDWMFVPPTLWPFDVQEVLAVCLAALEKKKRLNSRQRLLIALLPESPAETICAAVANHEHYVQKGTYENLVRTQAKYSQIELANHTDPELRRQWQRIKATFPVQNYGDHKGVIRRTMSVERNLRPWPSANLHRRDDAFRATFDAFCLRWNLYGMQHDLPLLLKLAINITPYGTMVHIPAYWSFDHKRDIRWGAISKFHRTRVPGRQGAALAAGKAERMRAAAKLRRLDREVHQRGLKGEKKHEFLCAGLGWVPGTSPKRLTRLRAEFKQAK